MRRLLLALLFAPPAAAAPSPPRPNVVILNVDCLRSDRLGAFGSTLGLTPFLDSLLAGAVVFERAEAPSYLTWLVDGSILTSLYPSQNHLFNAVGPIRPGAESLPMILRYYGYRTAAFLTVAQAEIPEFSGLFDESKTATEKKNLSASSRDVLFALENSTAPLFVYWTVYDAHNPFFAPGKDLYPGDYQGPFKNPADWDWERQTSAVVPSKRGAPKTAISPEDLAYLTAGYDAGVARVDAGLKAFFAEAARRGLDKKTIFVLASEHGEDLKEHGFIFHRDLYEVNLHVPFALVAPGLKGRRVASPVSLLDVAPTLLGMLDIPPPHRAEGRDLSPLLAGRAEEDARIVYSERPPLDEYSARSRSFKYILRNPAKRGGKGDADPVFLQFFVEMAAADLDRGDEFYDLDADPAEQRNLAGSGKPEEALLRRAALAFRERMRGARRADKTPEPAHKAIFSYP